LIALETSKKSKYQASTADHKATPALQILDNATGPATEQVAWTTTSSARLAPEYRPCSSIKAARACAIDDVADALTAPVQIPAKAPRYLDIASDVRHHDSHAGS
jgi:hypothetical protein